MNIYLKAHITGITAADLDNADAIERCIDNAVDDLADELHQQLYDLKLDRLVRFCQTGSFE